jgi:DNA-binding NarL/FixJ family response regulator
MRDRLKTKPGVLVVDDCPIFREGLADLINRQDDVTCCGQAEDLAEVITIIPARKPELVSLDLRAREADGLESMKVLKAQFPDVQMLVISQLDEAVFAERALRAGALGYVMKEQPPAEILRAIRTVLRGDFYVSPKVSRMAVQRIVEQKPAVKAVSLARLTDRELHVFRAIGDGKANKQIALEMKLSVKTVETYREHLKYKLGLGSGAALVEAALAWLGESSVRAAAPGRGALPLDGQAQLRSRTGHNGALDGKASRDAAARKRTTRSRRGL